MTVTLIDTMGDDLRVVNAARVSYAKRSELVDDTLSDADAGLIRYLARNRHGTPFEHVVFTFHVRCNLGVAREWFRHRIGSFNEVSTRYVEMQPDFYVPQDEAVRRQVGKPGAYSFETIDDTTEKELIERGFRRAYKRAYEEYEELLQRGVAKEVARCVLPLGLLTEFYWTVNLRSLTNFLSLRTAPNALLEIRREAATVEEHFAATTPVCYMAWVEGGRQAI